MISCLLEFKHALRTIAGEARFYCDTWAGEQAPH
jgi:hypothetical protein